MASKKFSRTFAAALIPAMIGPTTEAVKSIRSSEPSTMTAAATSVRKKAAPCKSSLSTCPVFGCEDNAETAHGFANLMKRRKPVDGPPVDLTFDDFASLQSEADSAVGQKEDIEKKDRQSKLRDLTVAAGQVSEGDLVRLTGFLVHTAHANSGESVNCRLTGVANNDFHIPIAPDAGDSEFAGIVVEMIPQARVPGWTLGQLHKVEKLGLQVLVSGQLFYDNMHVVNDDEDNPIGGQPKRMSLWEIHRVTTFAVCNHSDSTCDASKSAQWVALEDWKATAQ